MCAKHEDIETKFEKAFQQASGANPVFPFAAKQQMAKMVEEIATTNNILTNPDNGILNTRQEYFIKGGNAAEEYHASSYNLDAILKDHDSRAYTDRRPEWNQHEWHGETLGKNANPDVILSQDGQVTHSSQLKYNKDAASTAGEMSQVKDGQVKYDKNDSYIGPKEQINDIKLKSKENIEKNISRDGDLVQREAYQQTHDKATDRLSNGEVSSKPLSKEEANEIGKGDLEKFEQLGNEYQSRSTLKQMGNAAAGAAAMSALVSGSVNTVRYIKMARDGNISAEDAVFEIVKETVCSAADSAVKAGANVGIQSLMVRYGTEKIVLSTLARQGMGAMLRTNMVTVGVTCGIDAIKDIVKLGMGDISKEEFYERQGKNMLATSAGVSGGALGAAAVSSAIAGMGLSAAVGNALMIAGGLSGGLIAGLAMTLAIENGIEKPYRELVQNTAHLQSAAKELERVSQTVFMGQVLFSKYLESDILLDQQLQLQMDKIDQAGDEALNTIMKL